MRVLIKLVDINYVQLVMCYCGMICFGSRGHCMLHIPFDGGIVHMCKFSYICSCTYLALNTIVWKIFIWNYFVVENVRENNFRGLATSTKIF